MGHLDRRPNGEGGERKEARRGQTWTSHEGDGPIGPTAAGPGERGGPARVRPLRPGERLWFGRNPRPTRPWHSGGGAAVAHWARTAHREAAARPRPNAVAGARGWRRSSVRAARVALAAAACDGGARARREEKEEERGAHRVRPEPKKTAVAAVLWCGDDGADVRPRRGERRRGRRGQRRRAVAAREAAACDRSAGQRWRTARKEVTAAAVGKRERRSRGGEK